MEKISGFLLKPITIDAKILKGMTCVYSGFASEHYGRLKAIQAVFAIIAQCGAVKMTPEASKMLDEQVELLKSRHGESGVNQKFFEGFWAQTFFILSRIFHSEQEKREELMRALYPFKPEELIAGS